MLVTVVGSKCYDSQLAVVFANDYSLCPSSRFLSLESNLPWEKWLGTCALFHCGKSSSVRNTVKEKFQLDR